MNKFLKKGGWVLILTVLLWSCSDDPDNPISGELPAIDLLDESYGPEPIQSMNVYLPAGRSTETTPLLVYIHGGAWVDGDKDQFDAFRSLAEIHFPEYAYVSIGYRLFDLSSGANQFPTQENDIISALKFISSQADAWNVSDDIVLAGASAGGHLALLHSFKHTTVGDIKSVIAFFPPTELTELFDFNFITSVGLASLLGGSPEMIPEDYNASSPASFINNNSVPTIFFHGTVDDVVPISQSELLANELENNAVDHVFRVFPGEGHGFSAQNYTAAFSEAAAFVKQYIP